MIWLGDMNSGIRLKLKVNYFLHYIPLFVRVLVLNGTSLSTDSSIFQFLGVTEVWEVVM